jgi:hypothetical protein
LTSVISNAALATASSAKRVDELWEDWMRQADPVLEDEALLDSVYEALQHRHPRSRTHGRPGTPAGVVVPNENAV